MRGFPGLVTLACLLAACHAAPRGPAVSDAWVRLPAVPGNPGAAYFTLAGGATPDTLLAVSTPAAHRAEMHESMRHAGMTAMRPLSDVALPAGATLRFAPGGRHVMLFDIGPAVKPGARIPLSVALAGGARLTVTATVVGAGDPAPGERD
jgi:periplasmic copper chaperone A